MEIITVATIFAMSLNVSNSDCNFCYNTEVSDNVITAQVVYKKSEDGKYLSHHLKYNYTYDDSQRLVQKEVLRWNADSGKWQRSHCLNYVYDMFGHSIEYALWNTSKNGYTDAVAKQTYREEMHGAVTIALYKWDRTVEDWVVQNNTVMMNPGDNFLASLELKM